MEAHGKEVENVEFEDFIWPTRKDILEKLSLKEMIHLANTLQETNSFSHFLNIYRPKNVRNIEMEDLVYLHRKDSSLFNEDQFLLCKYYIQINYYF